MTGRLRTATPTLFEIFFMEDLMEEDLSQVLNKFQDILKEKDIDLNNVLNSSQSTNSNNSSNTKNDPFNFDIKTIMKIKSLLNQINNQNSPRNNLLLSLKPFLKNEKKEKLDQYIQISNIISIIGLLNNDKNDV